MTSSLPSMVQNAFTKRLLAVYTALIKKEAIGKKKDFAGCIDINLSHLNSIEKHERNYPKKKEDRAIINLNEVYGVNPMYMRGTSETMFLVEPKPVERAVTLNTVMYNFNNVQEKKRLLSELEYYKRKYHECAGQYGFVAEDYVPYNSKKTDRKTDKNQDKTSEK